MCLLRICVRVQHLGIVLFTKLVCSKQRVTMAQNKYVMFCASIAVQCTAQLTFETAKLKNKKIFLT